MAAQGKSRARLWMVLHTWLALPVWGLLLLVCVSGTLLTVVHELQWLADPSVRAANPDGRPRLGYNALAAAVLEAQPQARILRLRDRADYLATEVAAQLPGTGNVRLYVNPFSGQVQGMVAGDDLLEHLKALHGWLMIEAKQGPHPGWFIVTPLALLMLGSVVTGLLVYKKFWRSITRPRLRLRAGKRVFWGDLHRLAGVWGLAFTLLMGITGTWFLASQTLQLAGVRMLPETPRVAVPSGPPAGLPDLDRMAAAAQAAVPGLRVTRLTLPRTPDRAVLVSGTVGLGLHGRYGLRIHVDPWTAQVVDALTPESMTGLQAASRLLPSLHFGDFGGLPTKLVWFVCGVLLSAVVFSGFLIWLRRRRD